MNHDTKKLHLYNQPHCEDGPAVERADGSTEWYLNGQLHRKDGPAVEIPLTYKAWYLNGVRHRENGPAIIRHQISDDNSFVWIHGYRAWYINGHRHREDGPAIEYGDGTQEWYYHGKKIKATTQTEFEAAIK